MNIVGWIRVGDQTACGGTVAEGEPTFTHEGLAFSFQGAKMACIKNCVIAEGFAGAILSNSRCRVLHGMKTSGGCPLLSSLNARDGVSKASSEAPPVRFVQDDSGEWAGKANEGYDQHFLLLDEQTGNPLPNRYYRMTFKGKIIEGRSDAEGKTEKVTADNPADVSIEVMPEGYTGESA
jgi:uncharacterized Zn-binding protein involved in type VI secretion